MNTAVERVMTHRAAASNKIFNRLRQIWMRGFVFELNGRESEECCALMETSRDFERHNQPTGRIVAQLEPRGFAIQPGQTCLRVGESESFAAAPFEHAFGVDPGTVVFYLDAHHTVPGRCYDLNVS